MFGRLTLPSGADVPPWLRGKTLQERFDKYHRQCPGQQADQAYLEDIASARRPAPQDPTATSLEMVVTYQGTEATRSARSGTPRQPHHPEHTIRDPTATGDPSADTEASEEQESVTISFTKILRARTRGKQAPPARYAMFSVQEVKAHTAATFRSVRPALPRTRRSHNGQRWTSQILPGIYDTVCRRRAVARHPPPGVDPNKSSSPECLLKPAALAKSVPLLSSSPHAPVCITSFRPPLVTHSRVPTVISKS